MTICPVTGAFTGRRSVGNWPIRPLSGVFSSTEGIDPSLLRQATLGNNQEAHGALRVLTANLHLFGDSAMLGDIKTPLYFNDQERLREIVAFLKGTEADVAALTEVWDPLFSHEISVHLKEMYPYRRGTPWEGGVSDVIKEIRDRVPFLQKALIERSEEVINYFARSHYMTQKSLLQGALRLFVSEDQAISIMQSFLDLPNFWGAGLCLLSRFPIVDSQFLPHEERADLDNHTGKGILKATLDIPVSGLVTVLLTHLQEGNSAEPLR